MGRRTNGNLVVSRTELLESLQQTTLQDPLGAGHEWEPCFTRLPENAPVTLRNRGKAMQLEGIRLVRGTNG